jgi:hypothetical protein
MPKRFPDEPQKRFSVQEDDNRLEVYYQIGATKILKVLGINPHTKRRTP